MGRARYEEEFDGSDKQNHALVPTMAMRKGRPTKDLMEEIEKDLITLEITY